MKKNIAFIFSLITALACASDEVWLGSFEFDQLNPVCIIDRINQEPNPNSSKAKTLRILLEVQLDSLETRDKYYLKQAETAYENAKLELGLAKSDAEILRHLEVMHASEEAIYSYTERLCVIEEWRAYTVE